MDLQLEGKVAFIAGSTRGIGLAIGQAFLREGARVVISGRQAEPLRAAGEALKRAASEAHVLTIQGDLTDSTTIHGALERTLATFGSVDMVIANIGSGSARSGWTLSREDWEAALGTNLVGGMLLASAALPRLAQRPGGSLTFISSIAGCEAVSAPIPYSAAKAALQSAVKSLARLAGPQGVRVNAVAPGNVHVPGGSWDRKLAERGAEVEDYIRTEVPLQRFGRAEEIADAVVFLASGRAAFITGACLVVDGGQTRAMV